MKFQMMDIPHYILDDNNDVGSDSDDNGSSDSDNDDMM